MVLMVSHKSYFWTFTEPSKKKVLFWSQIEWRPPK